MQIHEITEGLLGNVGRGVSNVAKGFAQGLTGANFPQQPTQITMPAKLAAMQQPAERIVLTVSQPGQTMDTIYYKTGDIWTNEQGQQITKPESRAYLDRLIPTHGKKETIAPAARKVSRRRTNT
jgi:hypothetical protein